MHITCYVFYLTYAHYVFYLTRLPETTQDALQDV